MHHCCILNTPNSVPGLVSVYDLALVKNLCQLITTEQNPTKLKGLLNLLRAAIRQNGEYQQGHQKPYWVTCPHCEHQMEVRKEGGPVRARYCENCDLIFTFTNEELTAAESVATD